MRPQMMRSKVFAWFFGLSLLGSGWAGAATPLTAGNGETKWLSVATDATNELSGMNGRVIKQGDGTLRLSATTNTLGKGTVEVRKGSLVYEAQPFALSQVALPQAAISQAFLWMAADTNVVAANENGTNVVMEWRDVRETAQAAPFTWTRAVVSGSAQKPVCGTDGLLPYLDFGRFGDSGNNKWLLWADSGGNRVVATNILHVFIVFACPVSYGVTLGDWTGTGNDGVRGFVGGNTANQYSTLSGNISGAFYLNGLSVAAYYTYPKRDYQRLHIDLSPPGTASNFCNDRNLHANDLPGVPINRQGGIRFREVLVFTNALSSADLAGIGTYLSQKWDSGTPKLTAVSSGRVSADVAGDAAVGVGLSGCGTLRKTGEGTLARTDAAEMNGLVTTLDAGALRADFSDRIRRNDSPLMALASGNQTLLADGTNTVRTAGGSSDTVTKTGSGVLVIGAVSNGVKKVVVSDGQLTLAPPLADTFAYEAGMTNASFEIHGTLANGGQWQRFYNQTLYGWTFIVGPSSGNGAGLAYDNGADSPFLNTNMAPDGKSVGFIEWDGALKTSVTVTQGGNYTVYCKAAARGDAYTKGDFRVVLGVNTSELMVATFVGPQNSRSAVRFNNYRYTAQLQQPGTYDLVFQSITNPAYVGNGYTVTVLDDIHIEQETGEGDILNGAGSFETVVPMVAAGVSYPKGAYAINPTNTPWTFSAVTNGAGGYLSHSGITTSFSPFAPQEIYEGRQEAWIMADASFECSVTYPAAGVYRLTFLAGGSDLNNGALTVTHEGGRVCELKLAAKTINPYSFVLPPVAVPGEQHLLRFYQSNTSSTSRVSVDAVRIERLPYGNIVSNCSFETGITIETNGVATAPTGTGWTFGGTAGIAGYASVYGVSASGSRAAFLVNDGRVGQEIVFPADGVYGLSFKAAAPVPLMAGTSGYDALHHVSVGFAKSGSAVTNTLGVIETRSEDYTEYTFRLPYVKAGVPYLLRFAGSAQGGNRVSLLDDVTLFSLETGAAAHQYPADLELTLAEGSKLNLDFSGTITLGSLSYGNRLFSGEVKADASHPFVSGEGTVYVAPRGTLILVR